jgi:hypothetical protein
MGVKYMSNRAADSLAEMTGDTPKIGLHYDFLDIIFCLTNQKNPHKI